MHMCIYICTNCVFVLLWLGVRILKVFTCVCVYFLFVCVCVRASVCVCVCVRLFVGVFDCLFVVCADPLAESPLTGQPGTTIYIDR